jgi:hypothetical protein
MYVLINVFFYRDGTIVKMGDFVAVHLQVKKNGPAYVYMAEVSVLYYYSVHSSQTGKECPF